MEYNTIRSKFINLYGANPLMISAPGRINLIGEHTDYNEGYVLPAAINKSILFGINKNDVNTYRFYASDLDEYYETNTLSKEAIDKTWAAYFIGVLAQFEAKGIQLSGIDCVFGGNIPLGAGLSSSAAIECGFAFGLNKIFNSNLPKYDLALMAQKAEHEYAGVQCGIMDQYASFFGKQNHVFRLDCRSHEHQYFPFDMNDFVIALVDTGVKHELASSEYNLRRQECEKGVAVIQKFKPSIKALRDVDEAFMLKHKGDFDPLTFKRCNYVVKENKRVMDACNALETIDFHKLGQLMYQSHEGLANEYQVSCQELDLLVDLTRNLDFVYGSRMMGGGFGGCTINLLERENKEQFQQIITETYQSNTGKIPNIYFVELSNGVSEV